MCDATHVQPDEASDDQEEGDELKWIEVVDEVLDTDPCHQPQPLSAQNSVEYT